MVEAKVMAVSTKILEYINFVLMMTTFLTGGKFSFLCKTIINLECKFRKLPSIRLQCENRSRKALDKLHIEEINFQKR